MGLDPLQIHVAQLHEHVIECKTTHEHAHPAPVPSGGNLTGILQGLPAHFQQHALLGVHQRCFTRRNAEEITVETVDILDLACPLRGAFTDHTPLRVVELSLRPPVRKSFGNGVRPIHEHLPQLAGTVCTSGKTAAYTNDCNTIAHDETCCS